jgi:hypothetical protein
MLAVANGRRRPVACDESLECPIEIVELADGSRQPRTIEVPGTNSVTMHVVGVAAGR